MTQKKKHSLIEAVSGTSIGLITSFIIQFFLYPLLDIPVSLGQNVIITAVFFTASIVRGYLVRRVFNKIF
jgi:high-affinity Fe2+/Pb2+ permease